MLIRDKAHPRRSKVRLGHASIKATLDTYGHVYEGIVEALVEDLNRGGGSTRARVVASECGLRGPVGRFVIHSPAG